MQTINYKMRWNNLKHFTLPWRAVFGVLCAVWVDRWQIVQLATLECDFILPTILIDRINRWLFRKNLPLFRAYRLIICRGMHFIHLSSVPSITTNFHRISFRSTRQNACFFFIFEDTIGRNAGTFLGLGHPHDPCRMFTFQFYKTILSLIRWISTNLWFM